MAHAILEIQYLNNVFPTEIAPYASEEALNSRIDNMQLNPQVTALIVYRPTTHLVRKQVWAKA